MREWLPGDQELGDPLSTAGDKPADLLARRVAETDPKRPLVRELGLGALQLWQALSEAQGRGRGDEEVAIMFTDLVDFSDWALEAGDEAALDLLRKVGIEEEAAICGRDGEVVKRMGDGLMAVFTDPASAVAAAHEACTRVELARGARLPAAHAGRRARRAPAAARRRLSRRRREHRRPRGGGRIRRTRCSSPAPPASGSTTARSSCAAGAGSAPRARRRSSRSTRSSGR